MLRNNHKRGVVAAGGKLATVVLTVLTLCLMGAFGFAATGCAEEEGGGGGGGGSSSTHGNVTIVNQSSRTASITIDGVSRGTVGPSSTRSWSILCGPTTIAATSATGVWPTQNISLACGGSYQYTLTD